MPDIKNNLRHIKKLIQQYEQKYQRPLDSVQLLAVSKKQSIEKILLAYEAGQTAFGENYLQEALDKMKQLSNEKIDCISSAPFKVIKPKKIAEHFSWYIVLMILKLLNA